MAEPLNGSEVPLSELVEQGHVAQGVVVTEDPEPIDPFGDSKTFQVTKPVNLCQLLDEINAALDFRVQMIMSGPSEPSEDDPATLYVSPGQVDGRTVQGKIKGHDPDPYYGMSEQEIAELKIVAKIRAGEVLTPEELTTALQHMLRPV